MTHPNVKHLIDRIQNEDGIVASFDIRSSNEFADTPAWLRVDLKPYRSAMQAAWVFVGGMSPLEIDHVSIHASNFDVPEEFIEEGWRLRGGCLRISAFSLWWTCYDKHSGTEYGFEITDDSFRSATWKPEDEFAAV